MKKTDKWRHIIEALIAILSVIGGFLTGNAMQ